MVANFGRVGFNPPVKLGHKEQSGDRAFGWVTAIRRIGSKLVADLSGVPAALVRLIKDRAYDAVSSEVFWNLERNGKTFRRVLKAVALLGAETPAVSDLRPLHTALNSIRGVSRVYTFHKEVMTMNTHHGQDPAATLQQMADDLVLSTGITVDEAMQRIMQTARGRELLNEQVNFSNRRQVEFASEADDLYGRSREVSYALHHEIMMEAMAERGLKYSEKGAERLIADPNFDYEARVRRALASPRNYAARDAWNAPKKLLSQTPDRREAEKRDGEHRQQRLFTYKIDQLARAHLDETGTSDYGAAVSHVFATNPDLCRSYAQESGLSQEVR
jgi:hypothetical protein